MGRASKRWGGSREANRHGNDAECLPALRTLTYCGLYDESVAADAEARRLDTMDTNLQQTLLLMGDSKGCSPSTAGAEEGRRPSRHSRGLQEDEIDARRLLTELRASHTDPTFRVVTLTDGLARSTASEWRRPGDVDAVMITERS